MRKTVASTLILLALGLVVIGGLLLFPVRHTINSLKATVVQGIEDALQKNVTLEIEKIRISLRRGLGFRLSGISLRE